MAQMPFTTNNIAVSHKGFGGGLNSTSGPLNLADNESSDLQNVDFDKFGSVLSRNGYTALNTTALGSSPDIDGLHWYEFDSSGTTTRKLIAQAGATVLKMDDLDGTWDDITGGLTITAGNHARYENFLNEVYVTNGEDVPYKWTGTGNAAAMTVPTGLTKAKHVKQFNNYLFLANVVVSAAVHKSRFYWSNLKDTGTWTATDFIEVSKDDGQEITGLKVLSDRLIIFKERSIYNLYFSGDPDIPFVLPGGGKTNSAVGCVAPDSIQEVENGLVFLSHDGFYFFDGNNSFKISDRINNTVLGLNVGKFINARSLVQRDKNRYWCSVTSSGQTENDTVLVWDWFNNAWSIYKGMAPNAMTTTYVGGIEERPYWGDYSGFVYRGDTGDDDYPLNSQTAIESYFWSNWKHYDDIVNTKGNHHIYIYYQLENSTITFAYSYDLQDGKLYSNTMFIGTSSDVYGSAVWNNATYASDGGTFKRRDLRGSGKLIRFLFESNSIGEGFQIDGVGSSPYLTTYV